MAGLSHGRRRLLLLGRIGRRLGTRRQAPKDRSLLAQPVVFVPTLALLLRAPEEVRVFFLGDASGDRREPRRDA